MLESAANILKCSSKRLTKIGNRLTNLRIVSSFSVFLSNNMFYNIRIRLE